MLALSLCFLSECNFVLVYERDLDYRNGSWYLRS